MFLSLTNGSQIAVFKKLSLNVLFINEAIVNVTIPRVSTGGRGVQPEQSSWGFAFAGRRWVAGGRGETPPILRCAGYPLLGVYIFLYLKTKINFHSWKEWNGKFLIGTSSVITLAVL